MAETITIINNSGKIISTGKHLFGLFKDAKDAYHEKKAHLKGDPTPGIKRAQTFDVAQRGLSHHAPAHHAPYPPSQYDHVYDQYYPPQHYIHHPEPREHPQLAHDHRRSIEAPVSPRRRSVDDLDRRSEASSQRSHRSHRSHRSSRTKDGGAQARSHRPPLTASNLRTLSEVSSTATSVPRAYRSPYAETAPRDMTVSRPTLAHAATVPPASQANGPASMDLPVRGGPPSVPGTLAHHPGGHADLYYAPGVTFVPPQQPALAHSVSDTALRKRKSIDMNLAYGSVPPDLASRTDLDPKLKSPEDEARSLMSRVQGMLLEAECLGSSATAIISKLQTNPEAAAAVALTLAELSALLTKMSPAFLGVVKGGAPAVFALLASPQFLIAAGAAVGVTVVMFGGWKIVKRMQQQKAIAMEAQQPVEMTAVPHGYSDVPRAPAPYPPTEYTASAHPYEMGAGPGYVYGDGSVPGGSVSGSSHFDEALVVEEELSSIETWRRGISLSAEEESVVDAELISPEALRSTIGDDAMSQRTRRTHRSHRSRRARSEGGDDHVPERKSSRAFKDRDGTESERSSSSRQRRHHSSREHGDDRSESDSHRSSRSKRTTRSDVKAIEDGSREQDNTLESVLRPGKEKKSSMLKSLFKKKEREREVSSVLV